MRLTLVRGGRQIHVKDLGSKYVTQLQEVALAERPLDVELRLRKAPRVRFELDEVNPPVGPLAPVESVKLGSNPYFGRYIDKVFNDYDMNAREAVIYLYRSGVEVSRINRVFSVGALGIASTRRLVPTRWSITAVDKIISDDLVRHIKTYDSINEVRIFTLKIFDNVFMAILIPSNTWWFEWMEAWFPGSTWNRFGNDVIIEGDWEGPQGRSTYPEIGGCYYAARLAVTEYLNRIKRKAVTVLLREIYGGFNLAIGVWFVREALRQMFLTTKPIIINDLRDIIKVIKNYMRINPRTWISKSAILRRFLSTVDLLKFR